MGPQITLVVLNVICVNLHRYLAQSADILNTLTPTGCVEVRKGLEGFSHAVGGAGAIAESRKARFFAEQKMRPNIN
jgi:hypothetical protein